ncbi:MAG TPA: hypothetical protein DHU85_03800 [Porphyromonadaceae bacterium]|jgi:hypothetical protein|nr:hypothetical protein [Porphyromonadaceae bacterium]
MTQEQIKRAANSYIDDFLYNHIDYTVIDDIYETGKNNAICEFGPDIFKAGAQWRINSVWHPINEDPGYGKYILVHFRSGNYTSWFASADILWDFKRFEVDEWAYVVDLLPADSE